MFSNIVYPVTQYTVSMSEWRNSSRLWLDRTDSQKFWELGPAQISAAAEIQDGLEMIGSEDQIPQPG